VVALYYYARILRVMILEAAPGGPPIAPPLGHRILLGSFAALVLLFGVWWSPIVEWSQRSLDVLRFGSELARRW